MRSFHAVTLALSVLGAGGAGWFARGHCIATPPVDAPSLADEPTPRPASEPVNVYVATAPHRTPGAPDSPSGDVAHRIAALAAEVGSLRGEGSTRWERIATELAVLQAQIGAIAVTQEAVAKKLAVPAAWPSDPVEVEKVRDRWRSTLEATEKTLWAAYPEGPDSREVGIWSRFDYHRRAKAALEAAADSASLRSLSEGEFRSDFTLTR